MYVNRDVEKILLDAAESFQVITIYGSRQVGKSTTVDYLFGEKFELVTLDDSEELNMAISSPRSFFESHPWPLISMEKPTAALCFMTMASFFQSKRGLFRFSIRPTSAINTSQRRIRTNNNTASSILGLKT